MESAPHKTTNDVVKPDNGTTSPPPLESQHEEKAEHTVQSIFCSSSIFRITAPKRDRPELRGDLIIKNRVKSLHNSGLEAMSKSQFETAVICFTKAITLQPNQIQLHVDMGEAYFQLCDFQSAIHSYWQACHLDPEDKNIVHRLAFIYYQQGQSLFDRGMFVDALEAFTKAAELRPDFRSFQYRRAITVLSKFGGAGRLPSWNQRQFCLQPKATEEKNLACLTALGRYSDSLKLVTKFLETDEPTADLFVLKARLHKQLNQVSLCHHNLKSAFQLSPACPEACGLLLQLREAGKLLRQQAGTKALEGKLQDALARINSAVQACPEEASYYLFRGTLHRRLKDFNAAIKDLVVAIELNESGQADALGEREEGTGELQEEAHTQLVLTYNDFAVQCFSRGLYKEGAILLSRAIEDHRDKSGLFINRGDDLPEICCVFCEDCFFKQGDLNFALADYQQAEELDPHNEAICARLAVIHNTMGLQSQKNRKYQEAAKQFSLAVKYNPGVSQYYENRGKLYYREQKLDMAKEDAINAALLDPTNRQVEALLLSLFPGCSLPQILSCEMAQTLRSQLADRIDACKQAVTPVSRVADSLEQLSVLDETESQSEETLRDSVNEEEQADA